MLSGTGCAAMRAIYYYEEEIIMIQSIGHTAITVADMEQSLKFYTEAMGFEKTFEIARPETGAPWIVYLNVCKGQFIELFYGGTEENPWKNTQIGFNHLCFWVDDIHAATQQVKDAGFQMDKEPKQGPDYNWQAWVTDPNGIRIELMQLDSRSPQAQYC